MVVGVSSVPFTAYSLSWWRLMPKHLTCVQVSLPEEDLLMLASVLWLLSELCPVLSYQDTCDQEDRQFLVCWSEETHRRPLNETHEVLEGVFIAYRSHREESSTSCRPSGKGVTVERESASPWCFLGSRLSLRKASQGELSLETAEQEDMHSVVTLS